MILNFVIELFRPSKPIIEKKMLFKIDPKKERNFIDPDA